MKVSKKGVRQFPPVSSNMLDEGGAGGRELELQLPFLLELLRLHPLDDDLTLMLYLIFFRLFKI